MDEEASSSEDDGIVRKITGLWKYRDENRIDLFETVRLEPGYFGKPKTYFQRREVGWEAGPVKRPDGTFEPIANKWQKKITGIVRIVPYRFPELVAAIAAGSTVPLFIVEGEKCVDSLINIGLDATTNPMGACKFGSLDPKAITQAFTGRRVVMIPDNDTPGWNHSEDVIKRLTGIASSIVRVCLPGLPVKGDVFDWLKAGGTKEQLLEFAENPPPEVIPIEEEQHATKTIVEPKSPHSSKNHAADSEDTIESDSADIEGESESIDDSHRLARLFLEKHQHPDGLTLRFWRGEFHEWRCGSYSVRHAPDALRPSVTNHSKKVVDKLYHDFVDMGLIDPQKQSTSPDITRGKIGDVLQAMSGITGESVPLVGDQPLWLGDDPPFPNLMHVVATRNKLIYLPEYFKGWTPENRKPNLAAVIPATPKFFSPAASPFDFDPEPPKPEAWASFINSIWGEDEESAKCLQEWFGYLLTPDTSRQKMLLVVGPRRSGKGTIIEVLTNLVGELNTVATSLDAMTESFVLEDWIGKTVAVIADSRDPEGSNGGAVVERLLNISGGDRVRVNRKGIKAITTRLHARIVMFTNEIPRFYDASEALSSRFCVLRMTKSFLGNEDLLLGEKLRQEMPSIFKWALGGWRRLQTQKQFTNPRSAIELIDEFADIASPIGAFVRQRCKVAPDQMAAIEDLFEEWKKWCVENNHTHPGTRQSFAKRLRAAVPSIESARPRKEGNENARTCIYRGISVSPYSVFENL